MYPNNSQPPASQLPPSSDPYDFLHQTPESKSSRLPLPGGMKGRIIVVAVGLLILLIGFVIVLNILGSGDRERRQTYIEVAQRQTEIIRIASLAESKSKSVDTRSYALTAKLAITTSQKETNEILAKRGIKDKELSKLLSASKNSKSDTTLAEAEKLGKYDEAALKILDNEIANYQKQLKTASSGATKSEKTAFQNALKQAETIQQAKK